MVKCFKDLYKQFLIYKESIDRLVVYWGATSEQWRIGEYIPELSSDDEASVKEWFDKK